MRTFLLLFLAGFLGMPLMAREPLSQQFEKRWQPLLPNQLTQPLSQSASGSRELVQVYDTIYEWDWNRDTWQWDLMHRYIDLQYNDEYAVVGSTIQQWTGSTWQNYLMSSMAVSDDGMTMTTTQMEWIGNGYENVQRMIAQVGSPTWMDTIVTIQNWTAGDWVNEYRWTLGHHDHGPLAYELDQVWDGGAWVNTTKFEYWYEDWSNNYTEKLISEWMDTDWMEVVRYTMTYYQNATMSGRLEEFNFGNIWVNSTMDTLFTYNDQGSMTSYTRYVWSDNEWVNMYKEENTYDAHNNRTKNKVFQWWNNSFWSQISELISNYTYDANDFIMGESELDVELGGPMGLSYKWGDSTNYVYHTVVTGTQPLPLTEAALTVYPNPGRDVFMISSSGDINRLELFDLSGHLIQSVQPTTKRSALINLADTPPGVYILRAKTDTGPRQQKIVKQ